MQSRELPDYVHREFEDYLKCGRIEHGFLRVRCESCHAEHLVAFSCRGSKPQAPDEAQDQTQAERRAAMTWAQRLKRVFNIDIETCSECGGAVKVIACIEDPVVIKKILTHLKEKAAPEPAGLLPSVRAPPPVSIQRTGRQVGLFD